jgi:hypothetical protein
LYQEHEEQKDAIKHMNKLVKQAQENGKALEKAAQGKAAMDILLAKDAQMKATEAALANAVVASLGYPAYPLPPYYGYPYTAPLVGYPLPYYPYNADVAAAIDAVNEAHRQILQYEYDVAIASLVPPEVMVVKQLLNAS